MRELKRFAIEHMPDVAPAQGLAENPKGLPRLYARY
jgi:hypothetical protein